MYLMPYSQEVQVDGKPFLLDIVSRRLYKEVRGATSAPEHVGKWVQVRIPEGPVSL
jgi:hypothetical protein